MSARSNPNIISLCGVREGSTSADFSSRSLQDQEMPFVAHDLSRSPHLRMVDLTDNPIGEFGKLILAETVRENMVLQSVRLMPEPWRRTQCDFKTSDRYSNALERPYMRGQPMNIIQRAKVHSLNFRMAVSLFIKEFGVDRIPTRLIFEFLFGFTHKELEYIHPAFKLESARSANACME